MKRWGQRLVMACWLVLAAVVLWRVVGLYQGPWEEFAGQASEFLRAASMQDSTHLSRLGGSPAVVHQVLETARLHPEQFNTTIRLEPIEGHQNGDTSRVVFGYPACSGKPLTVTFRGTGWKARIEAISLPCGSP